MSTKRYCVLGLMSGSSLDGLDIAYCQFDWDTTLVDWQIIAAETLPFSESWQARLAHLPQQSALNLAKTHTYFGHYTAELIQQFLNLYPTVDPDFVAMHGHTIFHDPERRFTTQIGDAAATAALTGLPVINHFRGQDIAINGEGTPLAPIADQYLLPGYDFYLNLGGIANISAPVGDNFIAFDLGGCNQILNALAQSAGLPYDAGGQLAAQGNLLPDLLNSLNALAYFQQDYPKSLDNQWTQQHFVAPFMQHEASIPDKLHTACQHIGQQVAQAITQIVHKEKLSLEASRMIVTGGGAHNDFLMDCIQQHCTKTEIIRPDRSLIDFKEAALMALLGVLRVENQANTRSRVTGARRDTIGGAIHQGWRKKIGDLSIFTTTANDKR